MDSGSNALVIMLAIYFIPGCLANIRKHPQQMPIFLLNLLLGWTFVGWVVALIWAASSATTIVKIEETPKSNVKVVTDGRTVRRIYN